MWFKEYKDFQSDTECKKEKLTQGQGFVGCEMHDIVGWGETQHEVIELRKPHQPGILSMMAGWLFGSNLKRR